MYRKRLQIISILKNKTNVDGAACDISKQALNVAKENARLNGVFFKMLKLCSRFLYTYQALSYPALSP